MAKHAIIFSLTVMMLLSHLSPTIAEEASMGDMHHSMMMDHHAMDTDSGDTRISLGLSAPMRRNQLVMMRDHLKSVDRIVALIAAGKFNAASDIAHTRLGLTPAMKKMCSMPGNAQFQKMGIAFHQSADHLAGVLKKGDTGASLRALHHTMQYCISCHQTFRQ